VQILEHASVHNKITELLKNEIKIERARERERDSFNTATAGGRETLG
jgi:hypothetical protein